MTNTLNTINTTKTFAVNAEPSENELISIEKEMENENFELPADDNGDATEDSLLHYYKEIGAVKLLTLEEEQALGWKIYAGKQAEEELPFVGSAEEKADCIKMIEDGKAAQDRLVEANLRLVASMAKKYSSDGMEPLDIISEGNLGLIKAASKYDITKGFRFTTYATWWIKQAIQRGINQQSNMIRIPVYMCETLKKIRKAQSELSSELGRDATTAEVAERLHTEQAKIEEVLKNTKNITSLDAPITADGEDTLLVLVEDKNAKSPEDKAIEAAFKTDMASVLDSLPERHGQILRYLFGFYGRYYTLEEVGQIYGLSRERVRQIREEALRRIRGNKKTMSRLDDYRTM